MKNRRLYVWMWSALILASLIWILSWAIDIEFDMVTPSQQGPLTTSHFISFSGGAVSVGHIKFVAQMIQPGLHIHKRRNTLGETVWLFRSYSNLVGAGVAVAVWPLLLCGLGLCIYYSMNRQRRYPAHCCKVCGYDLRHCIDQGCPECGWNRPEGEGEAGDKV